MARNPFIFLSDQMSTETWSVLLNWVFNLGPEQRSAQQHSPLLMFCDSLGCGYSQPETCVFPNRQDCTGNRFVLKGNGIENLRFQTPDLKTWRWLERLLFIRVSLKPYETNMLPLILTNQQYFYTESTNRNEKKVKAYGSYGDKVDWKVIKSM